MKRSIEFVGYGGIGREQVAWLVARDIVNQMNLVDKVELHYSGSHVFGQNANDDQMRNYMRKILSRVLDKNGLDQNLKHDIRYSIDDNNLGSIKNFYERLLPQLKSEEKEYLTEAIKHFDIKNGVNLEDKSIILLANVKHIFCMEQDNLDIVENLYRNSNLNPSLELVLLNNEKIPGAFGKTKEDYFRMVEQIKTYVENNLPKVLENF
jgi:hypothetical protein